MAVLGQTLADMGAEEPGGAGDHYAHLAILYQVGCAAPVRRLQWPLMGSLARPRSLAGWTVVAAAGLGLGLRVYASAGIWPADLSKHDTAAYVRAAHYGLGKDPLEPTGYSIFLRVLHFVWAQLAFTVAVQHLLGLAAGALLYLAVRRLGASPWIALAGAAAIWLNGDQILLEQTLLSEGLFVFVLMAAVYSLVRSRDSGGYLWPALAAGLTVALPFIRALPIRC